MTPALGCAKSHSGRWGLVTLIVDETATAGPYARQRRLGSHPEVKIMPTDRAKAGRRYLSVTSGPRLSCPGLCCAVSRCPRSIWLMLERRSVETCPTGL